MRIVQAVGATHPGSREHNEDALLRLSKLPLFAVADGMGGPGAGDVAANIALTVLKQYAPELKKHNRSVARERTTSNRLALGEALDEMFNKASRAIQNEANELGMPGMGSTLLFATVVENFAYIAHVGDSRGYLVREGGITRLTEDHSLAEFRYRRGKMSHEEYLESPDRQVLYQALGAGMEVEVDLGEVRLTGGDILLLCTDGLVRALTEDDIVEKIDPADLSRSVRRLIRSANAAGAPDNITCILFSLESEEGDEPIQAVTDVMKRVFLFKSLSEPERLVIAPYLEEVTFEKGDIIVKEGEPADAFYVVIAGKVDVSRGPTFLTKIRTGGHFGELALARPVRRSATVKALQRTSLLSLSRDRFHELVQHKPELGARLALSLLDTVGNRLRDLSERLGDVERASRGDFQGKKPRLKR
ncbi:MAG: cyclic nucleotide-binding domain-containing protein [Proteobacteria bacterium]|nr:cyclic nucleotide-binding domain-containing protein [Pseudomonadota bacterium]